MINLKSIYGIRSFVSSTDRLLGLDLYFSTDNREISDEFIFIAIVGKKYNPLNDLQKVVDAGCRFVVYEQSAENDKLVGAFEKFLVFIKVENIISFIEEAGKAVTNTFRTRGGKILAISGSNGKTTTKEMVFDILSRATTENEVICTQKNNNNNLGVPFTLFQIRKSTRYAIVEVGSNHPGEIEVLARILYPQYAVTTNIGDTHLEFFKNREEVYKEESVIAQFTSDTFFLNADDSYLQQLKLKNSKSFGHKGKDFKFIKEQDGIKIGSNKIQNSHITGDFNFFNLSLACVLSAALLNRPIDTLIPLAKEFKPTANRSQWLDHNGQKVFLDAYNANPSSMILSLEAFLEYVKNQGAKPDELCLILGDMNELGPQELEFHTQLGKELNNFEFGKVVFVGRFTDAYAKKCTQNFQKYSTGQDVRKDYDGHIAKYKYVFIKGSRSLQLETILDIKYC